MAAKASLISSINGDLHSLGSATISSYRPHQLQCPNPSASLSCQSLVQGSPLSRTPGKRITLRDLRNGLGLGNLESQKSRHRLCFQCLGTGDSSNEDGETEARKSRDKSEEESGTSGAKSLPAQQKKNQVRDRERGTDFSQL